MTLHLITLVIILSTAFGLADQTHRPLAMLSLDNMQTGLISPMRRRKQVARVMLALHFINSGNCIGAFFPMFSSPHQ